MKAMILAAGKGTRLQPITQDTPKPLIPLLGRPVIDLILQTLAGQGIRDIAINTSYLGGEISKFCQSGAQYDANILFSYEGYQQGGKQHCQPLGSAGGLRNVQQKWQYFDDTFVVVCGDAYFDINLWDVVRSHNANGALATVVTRQVGDDELHKYGVVVTDESGKVTSFQEKPLPGTARSNMINTGIYLFNKEIFDYIPETGEYDIGSQLLPAIVAAGCPFYAFETDGSWLDIGNIKDIHGATASILNRTTPLPIPGNRIGNTFWAAPGAVVRPASLVTRGAVFVNSGAIVEAGAVITGPAVIGRNCEVRPGARIERSIVMGDHLVFEAHCDIRDKLVTNDHIISLDGSFELLSDVPELGIRDSRVLAESQWLPTTGALSTQRQQGTC
ncbi:MAG: NDP-sugar synthase [Pseudomonadales bacterium]|nr:NDP-sugar synthase [Pseudomonadales bacterium]